MIQTTDLMGNVHQIDRCTVSNIPNHFSKVQHLIPEEDRESYLSRMLQGVQQGTAFCVSDHSCFLYYLKDPVQPEFSEGVSLFGVGNPLKVAAMFSGIFTQVDNLVFVMKIKMHKGRTASNYQSIATASSIKNNSVHGSPLVVRIDKLLTKLSVLATKRGV